MISSLRGTTLSVAGALAVVEVGGVGYAVQITPAHALSLRPGEPVFLHTSLVVREDSLSLFGFAEREELEIFELLTGVSGVGPKSAMGVLAVLTPEEIARAVEADDDAAFRKVSGIGPKTAKLIVLQLTGKVVAPAAPRATPAGPGASLGESVLVALVGLGWPERTAAEALETTIAETAESERDSVPALLRLALGRLGPASQRAGR